MRVYVSSEIPKIIEEKLEKYGEVLLLPPFLRIDTPVSCHADMLMFYSSIRGKTVVPEEYYKENRSLFCDLDIDTANESFCPKYPNDIWLDACKMGEYLFCNEKHTSEKVKRGYKVIDVKQGYAGCSVLKVGDNALISADGGICKKGKQLGMDILKISAGNILLDGYSFGFIGGASFVCGKDVLFFGDVTRHPDYNSIKEFLIKYKMNIINIEGMPLTDYGSALCVDI